MTPLGRTLVSLAAVALLGCRDGEATVDLGVDRPVVGPPGAVSPPIDEGEAERRTCEARLREVLARPAAPGVPALGEGRAAFLAQVKAEPVVFLRPPTHGDAEVSLTVRGYREMLAHPWTPQGVVAKILAETERSPAVARAVLLTDGYLYAETPELGRALVAAVQPHQLFGHDRIWIQRGSELLHAERRRGRYHYLDGPLAGERVRLVLFDRAGGGSAPPPASHVDLRALRYELHFDRAKLRHVTEDALVVNLRYGKWWVPTVLRADGPKASVECEVLAPHLRQEVAGHRLAGARRMRALQGLRRAMLEELEEALPFDEPRREYGFQLDGTLRKKWLTAYLRGRRHYEASWDRYPVFDSEGRALPPQVCVDFLTDTFERMSGTWFRPRGEPPQRVVGALDFDALVADRQSLRRAPGFVEFAASRPDWFEVREEQDAPEMGDAASFYAHLEAESDAYQAGDAVLIKGKTPWDPARVHFHSFFVYETDPVTGMPLVVLGNAGRPSLRSWETEARRTPARRIVHRIRPTTGFLEGILRVPPLDSMPPLAAGSE